VSTLKKCLDKIVRDDLKIRNLRAACKDIALKLIECCHTRATMRFGFENISEPETYALAIELASESINAAVKSKTETP